MASVRFVAYQPTGLQMVDGRATHADESSIAADLTVLRSRFDGLITYGALHGAERVPDVAARLGFKAVILGVWDVANEQEISNAIAAWTRHPRLVVGASLGNEVVFDQRGDFKTLEGAIDKVRAKAPGLALSTTEPFHVYLHRRCATDLRRRGFSARERSSDIPTMVRTGVGGDRRAVRRQCRRSACGPAYCGPILSSKRPACPPRRQRLAIPNRAKRRFTLAFANCLRRRRHARSRTFRHSTRRGESRMHLRSTANIPRKRIGGYTMKPGGQKPSSRQFQGERGEGGARRCIRCTVSGVAFVADGATRRARSDVFTTICNERNAWHRLFVNKL